MGHPAFVAGGAKITLMPGLVCWLLERIVHLHYCALKLPSTTVRLPGFPNV
jgi:hypothetical protein